jgi:N-methylhydantoinase A
MKKPRKVWYRDYDFVDASIYERNLLPIGATFDGPAIVEQQDTTTVIPPRTHCKVDPYANIIINVEK